jgi:rhodanese-related sulfurtransferase
MIITQNRSPFYPNIYHEWPSVIRKIYRSNNDVLIIDIREPWEYEDHHIPDSLLIPMNFFHRVFPKLDLKYKNIVIVCEHGNRSTYLVNIYGDLLKGYKVYNMLGGISLWMRMGYEIESGYNSNAEVWKNLLEVIR